MHLGLSYRALVSLKLEYELWESLHFNVVPYCPQAQISNILGVQKKKLTNAARNSHLIKT
jgi:hypothetical protein